MVRKTVSGIMLALLLASMLILAFNIRPVKSWNGTVYIRSDGSIDPPSAPIQRNGDLYTLTDNITSSADGFVIERNNMTLDGAGYTVNGTKAVSAGIRLSENSNVTVKNIVVREFYFGIAAYGSSSNNNLTQNTITDNYRGISISDSSNNDIIRNNITSNRGSLFGMGISLSNSSNNNIVGNYIFNNYGLSAGYGIYASHIRNNSIIGNNIDSNFAVDTTDAAGIYLGDASDNNIIGNNVTKTYISIRMINGIVLFDAFNNTIFGNNISRNGCGVVLGPISSNNSIVANQLITNTWAGVDIWNATGNSIYHNSFVGNAQQVYMDYPGFPNAWDNGYPSGGNYWSDYTDVDSFKGPGQSVPGNDGIWDHSYVIDANNTDRYPLANPWLVQETLTARGMDDGIYYRCLSEADWQDWMVLPGSTVDTPATAELGNQLHFVVRGSDGTSLWHGYLTNPVDPSSFSGWTLLSGATSSAPTLASNGTVLCLVVRGLDNRVYYRCYSSGYSWGVWHTVPTGATSGSPAATMYGNDLHIVVRGMDGSSLWDIVVACNGTVVRDWMSISGATPSKPVLACSSADNLYLVVRGMDNAIYYRNYTGSTDSWADWSAFPTGATNDGPGATVMGNMLCMVVRGSDGNTLWCGDVDLGTNNFLGWTLLDGATPSAPTLTS